MSNIATVHLFKRPDLDTATIDGASLGAPDTGYSRIANLHDRFGHYYVARGDGSGIRVQRADGITPRGDLGGFVLDLYATSDSRDTNPALVARTDGSICLFFERAGSVYCTRTGDRGETWDTEMSQIPGVLPAVAINQGPHKSELLIAVQDDGTLQGTIQRTGDRWPNDNHTGSSEGTSSDTPFTLVDDAAAPLVSDGTGPALSGPFDGTYVLAFTVDGESDLSHWRNGDFGRTWERVS